MSVRDLEWETHPADGRLRCARFVERMPFEMKCLAQCANEIAERVRDVLAAAVPLGMLAPVLLAQEAWEQLRAGSRTYDARGERADATVLLDERTTQSVAAFAFGEHAAQNRELSALEARAVDRFGDAVRAGLEPVCGQLRAADDSPPAKRRVYCGLRLGVPLDVVVGVVFHEHDRAPATPALAPRVLEDCPIECRVRLGAANVDIFTVARFAVGDLVRLETKVGAYATLNLGPEPIAAGEGGVLGDRTAFKVHHLI